MKNPVWLPESPESTQMWQFLQHINQNYQQNIEDYPNLHKWSVENPSLFWQGLCHFFNFTFHTQPSEILSNSDKMMDAQWFSGATFNFAEKLLSGPAEKTALVSIKENGERTSYTYQALKQAVIECAQGLKKLGVEEGDRVAGYLPNLSETERFSWSHLVLMLLRLWPQCRGGPIRTN